MAERDREGEGQAVTARMEQRVTWKRRRPWVILCGGLFAVLVIGGLQVPNAPPTGGGGGVKSSSSAKAKPVNYYQQALNTAEEGYFEAAVGQLYYIPPGHKDYRAAQQKIAEYKEKNKIKQRAERLARLASYAPIRYAQIRENNLNLTSIQFADYVESIKGKRVRWTGYAGDVEQTMFGGYRARFDMDAPEDLFSIPEVTFDVSEQDSRQITKGGRYTFVGTIDSVVEILTSCQVRLRDVEWSE